MLVSFVGAIPSPVLDDPRYYSPAGKNVQCEIIKNIEASHGSVLNAFLTPVPSWPRGPLWVRNTEFEKTSWLAFFNFPFLKQLSFSLSLLVWLFIYKPKLIYIYNVKFFCVLTLLLYRFISADVKLVVFIQDILPCTGWDFRNLIDYFAIYMAKRFDVLLPISEFIAKDFGFDPKKTIIVQGGVNKEMVKNKDFIDKMQNSMVFCGKLERYNGLDKLIHKWKDYEGSSKLYVYGDGSLRRWVEDFVIKNKSYSIEFHGRVSSNTAREIVDSSGLVFVLRYSIGINANYFFPSKFFEAMISNSVVVCNEFPGLPSALSEFCILLKDDLSDINLKLSGENIEKYRLMIDKRKEIALEMFSWDSHFKKILRLL